jgi:hypothetical protein
LLIEVRPTDNHGIGARFQQLRRGLGSTHHVECADASSLGERDDVAAYGGIGTGLSDPCARREIHKATEQKVGRQGIDTQHRQLEGIGSRIYRDGIALVDRDLVLPGAVLQSGKDQDPLAHANGIDGVAHGDNSPDALGPKSGGQGRAMSIPTSNEEQV